MLKAHREQFKEMMATGRTDEKHWELVGQCKALQWTIDKVTEQIRSINAGVSDGDD